MFVVVGCDVLLLFVVICWLLWFVVMYCCWLWFVVMGAVGKICENRVLCRVKL